MTRTLHVRNRFDRRAFLHAAAASGLALGSPRLLLGREGAAATAKDLIYHQRSPNNAEPALPDLVESWITPLKHFYVRSHGPNPQIVEEGFTISVEGRVRKPTRLSLAQIRESFPQARVTATMTCAGNRRNEHSQTKPVAGVPWGAGAVGNAVWGGVPLAEILKRAELLEGARHVWFEGVDQVDVHGEKSPFGGSIPLDKALAAHGTTPGCLVAWQMNGAPLPPDHGFPVRTVVPGYIGARSVKWLGKIVVSDRPSPNHFVADAYKVITEETPEQLRANEPIYQYPINSVICVPPEGAQIKAGGVLVQGYSLAAGAPGRTVERVELSTDGAQTWRNVRLDKDSAPFCWRLWSATVKLEPEMTTLLVRATDSAGQTQPQATPWNLKGYLYNGWHKRQVKVAAS